MTNPRSVPQPFPAAQSWLIDNAVTRALAARFVRRLGLRCGMRVLDVGCGPGRLTIPIAAALGPAGHVVALDLQRPMLDRLERRAAGKELSNIRLLCAKPQEAELPSRAFDLVVLAYVLGEVRPDERTSAMRALGASLAPEGRLVVVEGAIDPHRLTAETIADLAGQSRLRIRERRRWPLSEAVFLESST